MASSALTHKFLRLRLLLSLALVLAASLFAWGIDRAKHDLMVENSVLSETLDETLQGMTIAASLLHRVELATRAEMAANFRSQLGAPAAKLDLAHATIKAALTEERLSPPSRRILENEVLDPLGLIATFVDITEVVAERDDLWGEAVSPYIVQPEQSD